jgi:hypothetical protein
MIEAQPAFYAQFLRRKDWPSIWHPALHPDHPAHSGWIFAFRHLDIPNGEHVGWHSSSTPPDAEAEVLP